MGAQEVLSRKTGVIVGDDVLRLFEYAREHKFAIPAIVCPNHSRTTQRVTTKTKCYRTSPPLPPSSLLSRLPAMLRLPSSSNSPRVVPPTLLARYVSQQKLTTYSITKLTNFQGVSNTDQAASIAGSVAAAHYIRSIAPTYGIPVVLHTDHCAKKLLPWLDGMMDADEAYFKVHGEPLFSSHMIDLSEEPVEWNIETTAKYLKRAAPMKQWLEMEIGITGGEEDGVNNEDVDNNSLYTQPEDILNIYQTLSPISPYFSIAAGFGNVHGVYKPGNVKLHPELLGKHQAHVKEALKSDNDKPVFFVFHGGSGSSKQEYLDAIGFGVVKVNVDTDMQFAYCSGIRDYMVNKREYVNTTVGNPDGEDKPNKKYFDVSLHYILRHICFYTNFLLAPCLGSRG
jgi:fructose-bisphosphate aldolase class II